MAVSKRDAVAALTAGDDTSPTLTIDEVVVTFTKKYLRYTKRAAELEEQKSPLKHRLFYARAMECAEFLADYFTRVGSPNAQFWAMRRTICEGRAFNHKNQIADSIGAGGDSEPALPALPALPDGLDAV